MTITLSLPKRSFGDFLYGAMAILANSQGVYTWGNNTTGALSNGTTAATSTPLQPALFNPNSTPPPATATITDWAFTMGNLYLVFSNGWAYSSGDNTYGQLAQGDTVARPYLTRIEYFITNNLSVQKVWAAGAMANANGGGCVFFQTLSGSTPGLYACGSNTAGNCGNASSPTTNLTTPGICAGIGTSATVTSVAIASIGGPNFSTYALLSNGSVMVCGFNANGQLGNGTVTSVTGTFVNALAASGGNLSNITALSVTGAGGSSGVGWAMALDSSGNLWSTGYNVYGQLGLGSTTSQTKFTQVTSLTNVAQFGTGGGTTGYSYAITSSGALYTWGYNALNNLFQNSTTSPITSPTTTVFSTGQVSTVVFPKEEAVSGSSQLIALIGGGTQVVYAGQANGQLGINSSSPAYKILPLPPLASGETIDSVFMHGSATLQRLFLHTSAGNILSCGYNSDSVCTGGWSSNSMPTSIEGFNLRAVIPSIPLL